MLPRLWRQANRRERCELWTDFSEAHTPTNDVIERSVITFNEILLDVFLGEFFGVTIKSPRYEAKSSWHQCNSSVIPSYSGSAELGVHTMYTVLLYLIKYLS